MALFSFLQCGGENGCDVKRCFVMEGILGSLWSNSSGMDVLSFQKAQKDDCHYK